MHRDLKNLIDYRITATDGEIGKVSDVYFDEQLWTVRYLIVNTGGWLNKHLVLLSPIAVDEIKDSNREIKVTLTQEQVAHSPDVDLARPVSRQMELELSRYYRTGLYWVGYNIWGPAQVPLIPRDNSEGNSRKEQEKADDFCLRSAVEIIGYHVQTETGELGHISDIIINKETWAIDFFRLNTRNFFPGEDIEFSIRWIKKIDCETHKVYLTLTRELIRTGAES